MSCLGTVGKGHQPEIEKEMNTAMREQSKRSEPSTRETTNSTVSTVSQTRKRVPKTDTAAIKLLQKHDCPIELRFD